MRIVHAIGLSIAVLLFLPVACIADDICSAKPSCDGHWCGTTTHVCIVQIDENGNAYGLDDEYKVINDGQYVCVRSKTTIDWNADPTSTTQYDFITTFDTSPFVHGGKKFNGGTTPPKTAEWTQPDGVKMGDKCYKYSVTVTKGDKAVGGHDPAIIIDDTKLTVKTKVKPK